MVTNPKGRGNDLKYKNIVIVLSICLNIFLAFIIYFEKSKEGPVDVGMKFKESVSTEDYTLTKTLFAEGRKQHISENTLKKVNEIMSAGTSFKTYQLLEFDNGEMVLLYLTPNKKYEIQDVRIVPEEHKPLFR